MSVVKISPQWTSPEADIERLGQLAVSLSGRMTRVVLDAMAAAIGESLAEVAAAIRVEVCELLEFTNADVGTRAYQPATRAGWPGKQKPPTAPEPWLVDHLKRGENVIVSRPEDYPRAAIDSRNHLRRTRPFSLLAVPASVDGQVICAVLIGNDRTARRWAPALVEQVELLSQLFAAAFQRQRHEAALRSSVTVIEQLNARLEADNVYLKEEIKSVHDFDEIVGESAALKVALTRLSQVAPTNASVLLLGPTGTGKELFARALHERSRRHARPLVRVNCAALPPSLVESELFGHEKGAFTGAVALRQGRFELADGGTIFLDEIGDLTPDIQVKLLRVLQEGEFERVGSSRTKTVDVRVIAATHRDLEAAVAKGDFRADLYYRLSVYPIQLPPLRERPEDIPRLVWFFIHRLQRDLGRHITQVPKLVMDAMQRHSWPGNVRELENTVERAMIASVGDTLRLDEPVRFSCANAIRVDASDNLEAAQRVHIESVLQRCGWRISGPGNAAERLGVHPNTLRFRMKKLGLIGPRARAQQQRAAAIASWTRRSRSSPT